MYLHNLLNLELLFTKNFGSTEFSFGVNVPLSNLIRTREREGAGAGKGQIEISVTYRIPRKQNKKIKTGRRDFSKDEF